GAAPAPAGGAGAGPEVEPPPELRPELPEPWPELPESPQEGRGISDTGQMDLLRLLQTQEDPEPKPAPAFKGFDEGPGRAEKPQAEARSGGANAFARSSIAAALMQTSPEVDIHERANEGKDPLAEEEKDARLMAEPMEADKDVPDTIEAQAAMARLNETTSQLQNSKLSHGDAAEIFSELLVQLPAGRLRYSALLNRAHCYVGMGKLDAALADIESIICQQGGADSFDARKWHKVWMSRGGIHRKLAQLAVGAAERDRLFAQARADYEHVLAIQPPHEGYSAKAQRCLQQLRKNRDDGRLQVPSPSPKRRRLEASRSRSHSPAPGSPPAPAPAPFLAPSKAGSPAGTALDTEPRPSACRALEALGEDCVVAGRRLFDEGAVNGLGGRCYEIGATREQVQLQVRGETWAGSCSCRLQGHCKHVAAALCFLQQEEREQPLEAEAGAGAGAGVGDVGADAPFRKRELARLLERRTNDELKSYLRLNNQLLSGAKAELVHRLAEAAVYGALAPCPRCGGHLHPEEPSLAPGTTYFCKRQLRDREACGYQALGQHVERRPFLGAEELLRGLR
ncbi:unnamed protein product, partial [Effrenium voratum]